MDEKEIMIQENTEALAEASVLESCYVDLEEIAKGNREIRIPEGITRIKEGAFDEYNNSEISMKVFDKIVRHEYYLVEWKKRLVSKKRFTKVYVPAEYAQSTHTRAEYLSRQEEFERLLKLDIPASVTNIEIRSMPQFLEAIEVDENNEVYRSEAGALYYKNEPTLIRHPGYDAKEVFEIPDGIETLEEAAFEDTFIHKLIIPASVKNYGKYCFRGCHIDELEFAEGTTEIPERAFEESRIEKIVLPESLRKIGAYAFEGLLEIKELVCSSDELMIDIGVFSKATLTNLDWWCWSVIPKAAFINAEIKEIKIPDGVVSIGDYAFAGCYEATKVTIPASVKTIGANSFDFGPTSTAEFKIHENLYQYVFRLPASAKVNKKSKIKLWEARKDKTFVEERGIIEKQLEALEKQAGRINGIQITARAENKALSSYLKTLL